MKKIVCIILFCLLFSSLDAQIGIPKAQAMFIYNFSRLIEWPESYKTGPFVIGTIGSSQTLDELISYTKGKTVGAQSIIIKKFNTPAEIATCQILFIPFAKTKMLPELMKVLGNKSTLIVTERAGATDDGAAVNFVIIGDKLKFEIKASNAISKQIKISSKLSEMAYKSY